MIITICAKCSDMFSARLVGDDGEEKGKTYRGYVPEWMLAMGSIMGTMWSWT